MKNLRTFMWSHVFGSFGPGSRVGGRIKVYHPYNVHIGSDTMINDSVILNARATIRIGNHCHVSPGVIINTGFLDIATRSYTHRAHAESPVVIEDGVWIGSNASINPGVTIHEGCIIGAGAVVTSDIPAFAVAVGVPARVTRTLTD